MTNSIAAEPLTRTNIHPLYNFEAKIVSFALSEDETSVITNYWRYHNLKITFCKTNNIIHFHRIDCLVWREDGYACVKLGVSCVRLRCLLVS